MPCTHCARVLQSKQQFRQADNACIINGTSACLWLSSYCAQPDPRFEAVLNLIRSGEFGWEGYFAQLIDSLSGSSDYYLLANDFPSYLEAQVRGNLHIVCCARMFSVHGAEALCQMNALMRKDDAAPSMGFQQWKS